MVKRASGEKSGAGEIPPAGEGRRGASGHLGYLLRQAAAATRAELDRAMADLGVTTPQFAVLTMLAAYPSASGADIARLALLTPQTVNLIVRNLLRRGAVARRPHESHGRILAMQLTDQGRAMLDACKGRVETVEARLAKGLSPEDERIARRWLASVAARFERV